jgi:hypothetical protein
MCYICQSYVSVFSDEYNDFIKEYYQFLECSRQTKQLWDTINSLRGAGNTQVFDLYTQALKAHIFTIRAFIELAVSYECLLQRYFNRSTPC